MVAVAVEADTEYNLSCKTSNLGGTYADMSLYFFDATGSTLGAFSAIPASSYTEYTLTATSSATTTSAAVYVYLDGAGQVLVDDCVLQATEASTPTNPNPNPPTTSNDLPWLESFSSGNGATSDADATAWTSSRASGSYGIQDGRFSVSDAGGEAVWQSEVIDITGANNGIAFSADVRSGGNLENSDYLRIYYKVDDGAEVAFYSQSGKINRNKNFRVSDETPAGSTVQIVVRISTDENRESYTLDNVSLQAR